MRKINEKQLNYNTEGPVLKMRFMCKYMRTIENQFA